MLLRFLVFGILWLKAEVDLVGKFYHPNVIKPLGFCFKGQELLLVYENAPKGNAARYTYKGEHCAFAR